MFNNLIRKQLYYIIAILTILLLIICMYKLKEHFGEIKFEVLKKYVVSKEIRDKILDGFKKIHEIFNKNDIFYVIEGGALLGAVRNNKLIPWDDDGDISVWKKDQDKIMSLANEFAKYGYELSDTVHPRVLRLLLDKNKKYPFIDLFLYEQPYPEANNNRIIRCLPENKENINNGIKCDKNSCCYPDHSVTWWWQNSYKLDNLHPRKIYKLNDIEVWGPNNPIPYIVGWYGKEAINTYKFTYSHDENMQDKKEYTFSPREIEEIYNKLYD